jgi:hypothetical protein
MNMFEKAARKKYRFPSSKGELLAEQLFDLPLQATNGFDLNSIAVKLHTEIQSEATVDFVNDGTNPKRAVLDEKLEIVKYVIQQRKQENDTRRVAAARKAEREQLLEILHNKRNAELLNLSPEEIEARIRALSDTPAESAEA